MIIKLIWEWFYTEAKKVKFAAIYNTHLTQGSKFRSISVHDLATNFTKKYCFYFLKFKFQKSTK